MDIKALARAGAHPDWVSACGVRFQLFTSDTLTDRVAEAVRDGRRLIVGNHNLHSVHLFHQHASMRRFFDLADVVHIDGMSIVALARLLGLPVARRHRISYMDWIDQLLSAGHRGGWRIFFLGGKPGVGDAAADLLRARYPNIVFAHQNGFFAPAEAAAVLDRINTFSPDVLFVGMGMPRQEEWIADNADALQGMAVLPCGACFDYLTGVAVLPPRWTGQLGVEWLFRLCCEPTRLWRRYLVEPFRLLVTLATKARRDSAPTAS